MNDRISVLIVDDHNLVREGFRSLLEEYDDIDVAGDAPCGRSALEKARELKPDVILMDIRMPGLSGLDSTRLILSELPATRVLGLSMHLDHHYVTEMLEAGASGYLLKDCPSEELVDAIREVMRGGVYLSKKASESVVGKYISGPEGESRVGMSSLTTREREIASLIAEGLAVREIAERLSLSIHTIHTHRKRIMTKLNLGSNAEITRFAIREGLTQL